MNVIFEDHSDAPRQIQTLDVDNDNDYHSCCYLIENVCIPDECRSFTPRVPPAVTSTLPAVWKLWTEIISSIFTAIHDSSCSGKLCLSLGALGLSQKKKQHGSGKRKKSSGGSIKK